METFFKFFINAILLISAIQGVVLGVLILRYKGKSFANKFLSIIIFFLSFSIFIHLLSDSKIFPFFYFDIEENIITVASILIAPFIYFYIKSLTTYQFRFKKNELIHFIPFICALTLTLTSLFRLYPFGINDFLLHSVSYFSFTFFFIYIILSHIILYSYTRKIKNNFSSISKINLKWLKIFMILLSLLWISASISDLFELVNIWDYVWLVNSVIIFLIGSFGFFQPGIFSESDTFYDEENKKYQKSSLTSEIAERYLNILNTKMIEQKLFLNNDINLTGLSKQLKIPTHHLSQIINENLGLNFYDYINSMRINEAKKLLLSPEYNNNKIAAIGFNIGFNSLSAFNAAFKKFTHKTPSQFKKENYKS